MAKAGVATMHPPALNLCTNKNRPTSMHLKDKVLKIHLLQLKIVTHGISKQCRESSLVETDKFSVFPKDIYILIIVL